MYDSSGDTIAHSSRVLLLMYAMIHKLQHRASNHDTSKLSGREKRTFDKCAPLLRDLTYGSPRYMAILKKMSGALKCHYAANRHHPEHFKNGIDGMTLLDLVEMIADWKAATERHADGDLRRSFVVNKKRFNMSPQLCKILKNTAKEMGWLK